MSIVTNQPAARGDVCSWSRRGLPVVGEIARDPLRRRMLAGADVGAALAVSLALATTTSDGAGLAAWSLAFVPVWLVLAKLHGLYDRDHRALRHLTVDELPSIFMWVTTGTAALAIFLIAASAGDVGASAVLVIWVAAALSATLLRCATRYAWRRVTSPERIMIVGGGPVAEATRRKLELFPDMHASMVEERNSLRVEDLGDRSAWFPAIDRVILASNSIDEQLIASLVSFCRRERIKLSVVPPARGIFGTATQLSYIADLPIVEYNTWDVSRSTLVLKRMVDIAFASLAVLLFAPVFVLVAVLIYVANGRPILFAQTRVGAGEKPFKMLKFRTMVRDAGALRPSLVALDELSEPAFKLSCDPRVTRLGRLLRKTSADELPQLVNVLRGDMSLVGPRPEEAEVVELYEDKHRFRLAVKPGLTGPMQIYGRGALAFQERLAVEREYIENLSLGRDLRILAMTVMPVLSGRGAY
jgi:exopolysaccharide biosynthesis polyprenyl glycosylphosphotransferase